MIHAKWWITKASLVVHIFKVCHTILVFQTQVILICLIIKTNAILRSAHFPMMCFQLYKDTEPIITSCVDGYNVTIMAYGQTGIVEMHLVRGAALSNSFEHMMDGSKC